MKAKRKSRKEQERVNKLLARFDDDVDDLIFWAFRYFLGRRTIHACCFAEDLARAWPHLEPKTANAIREELDKAFVRDDEQRANKGSPVIFGGYTLGDSCDRFAWDRVRVAYTIAGGKT